MSSGTKPRFSTCAKAAAGAAVAAVLISGAAQAADLPSRKVANLAPAPVIANWAGYYLGLNAGGAFGSQNGVGVAALPIWNNEKSFPGGAAPVQQALDAAAQGSRANSLRSGFLGGGQLGYNWVFGSSLFGLEADIQGLATSSAVSNFASLVPTPGADGFGEMASTSAATRVNWLGTLRGRIGLIAAPSFLLYATGGLAYGGVKTSSSSSSVSVPFPESNMAPAFAAGSTSPVQVGWSVGGGVEWMFAPNWSLKGEYLYYDLGSVAYGGGFLSTTVATGTPGFPVALDAVRVRSTVSGHIVRAGLNYHFDFGAPAPVVAKF